MPQDFIHVKGAREHNLKNIEITIPRDKLVVITGVSGSGKTGSFAPLVDELSLMRLLPVSSAKTKLTRTTSPRL